MGSSRAGPMSPWAIAVCTKTDTCADYTSTQRYETESFGAACHGLEIVKPPNP